VVLACAGVRRSAETGGLFLANRSVFVFCFCFQRFGFRGAFRRVFELGKHCVPGPLWSTDETFDGSVIGLFGFWFVYWFS